MLRVTKAILVGAALVLGTSGALAAPKGSSNTPPKPSTYASSPVTFTLADIGKSANVLFSGHVGGDWTKAISASASFVLKSVSANGKDWSFGYTLTNTSTATSRLRSIGFDLSGGSVVSATGTFANIDGGDNYPEGFGRVNTCLKASANGQCTGGKDGLWNKTSLGATTSTGTFLVRFATKPASLTLDRFVTRFQSIQGVPGGTSGIGVGAVNAGAVVPEPASWAMMIAGFGLVGATLRRRARPLAAA